LSAATPFADKVALARVLTDDARDALAAIEVDGCRTADHFVFRSAMRSRGRP